MHHPSDTIETTATISGETIAGMRLFSGLTADELERVASRMTLHEFSTGAVILARSQPAMEMYVILAGRVRVELQDNAGQILNLTELGMGAVIGERAILTDEARSADVRSITGVQAARLSREDFEELLDQTPKIYANLSRILAAQLGSWAHRHRREEIEHREVITSIIGWQLLPEFGAFPGCSPWVKLLNQRLRQLGSTTDDVLIVGEPGTWKDLAARLIHFHSDSSRPVMFLDCASPPPLTGQETPNYGSAQNALLLGLAQEAALFGHVPEGAAYARRVRRGMIELAAGGDLILRNIDCLATEVQAELMAFLESGNFKRRGETRLRTAQVRVIATSGNPLQPLVDEGKFDSRLYQRLANETVELAPLRERKKDIPVIAINLLKSLNAKHQQQVQRLSKDAINRLVDHEWPLNNTELYQVISRAVLICNENEVQPEHISLQGHPFGDGRFNLLSIPAVEKLARKPRFPRVLRLATVPLFLLVIFYTLLGPSHHNVANLAAWTVGWPALLLAAFLFARGWCSFCPMEAIGEYLGVTSRVVHDPPLWLRRWGAALSFGALVLILLLEQATGMFTFPVATGILFSGMLLATVSADLVIGRRGWCKFLCPLGRIVSMVSRISLLEMHSNHNVCLSRCRVDDCIKEKACPMGLHPSGIDSSDHCVMCLNCVRNCPHHSMQLDLRNPTCGVYSRSRRKFQEALFGVTLVGVVIAAKGTPLLVGRGREVFPETLWSVKEYLLALGVVVLFTGLAMVVSATRRRGGWRRAFTSCGSAYLPLAAAGLFMIYFRALVEGGAQLAPLMLGALGMDRFLDLRLLTPEFGTLRLLIYPIILAAALFSWSALGKLQRQDNLARSTMICHRLLIFVATAAFLAIL